MYSSWIRLLPINWNFLTEKVLYHLQLRGYIYLNIFNTSLFSSTYIESWHYTFFILIKISAWASSVTGFQNSFLSVNNQILAGGKFDLSWEMEHRQKRRLFEINNKNHWSLKNQKFWSRFVINGLVATQFCSDLSIGGQRDRRKYSILQYLPSFLGIFAIVMEWDILWNIFEWYLFDQQLPRWWRRTGAGINFLSYDVRTFNNKKSVRIKKRLHTVIMLALARAGLVRWMMVVMTTCLIPCLVANYADDDK